MKKAIIAILIAFSIFISINDASARGIGIKGGYGWMLDNYEDAKYKNEFALGMYFDMGTFIFNSLRFRPGFDYIEIQNETTKIADAWGIHFDWYWFFLGKTKIAPFLGFGPALNYYSYKQSGHAKDSDAGVEGFGGFEFDLAGPLSLMLEARYLWHDIATRNDNIFKVYVGLLYSF